MEPSRGGQGCGRSGNAPQLGFFSSDTRLLSHTARKPQYSRLIRHANGALATLKMFFTANSVRLNVRSASSPMVTVAVARARPMMVRNCRCQP